MIPRFLHSCTSGLCPGSKNLDCRSSVASRPPPQPAAAAPTHLSWGRTPGCRSGISLSLPRSTCRRWRGRGCCTASAPAARPRRRCESRARRAPTWTRSRPPVRKGLLRPCGVGARHPHAEPAQEPLGDSLHRAIPPERNPLCATREKMSSK